MARLPIYQPTEGTNIQPLQGTNPGQAGLLGQEISSFGAAVSAAGEKIKRHDELIESSQLAANTATIDAYQKIALNKAIREADPTKPDVHDFAQNFMDNVVNPNIEAIGQNITTTAGKAEYEVTAAKMRAAMMISTQDAQAALTGEAVKQSAITVRNSTGVGIYNDPTSFADGLATSESEFARMRKDGVPFTEAQKWKTDSNTAFAQAAVKGLAVQGPDQIRKAKAALDSDTYDSYLTAPQKDELRKFIFDQERSNDIDEERHQRLADKQQHDAAESATNDIISQLIVDPTKVSAKSIAMNKAMTPEQKHVMYDFLQTRLKGEDEGGKNGAGFWPVFQAINAPDGPGRITDPQQIYSHVGPKGDITLPAAQKLVEIMRQRQAGEAKGDFETSSLNEFFKTARDQITEPYGFKIEGGDEANYRFFMDAHAAYSEGRQSGKTPAQLLTPDSPDYIGKTIKSYVPKLNDDTVLDKPAPEVKSWWSSLFSHTGPEPFSMSALDKVKAGAEGSAAGIEALKAATAAGKISKSSAITYAKTRGWVQ